MKQIVLHLKKDWQSIKETAITAMTSGINSFLIEEDVAAKLRELGNVVVYAFSESLNTDVFFYK